MEAEFWLQRWEKREIGFHQVEINRYLEPYWPTLELAGGSTVLVPLCGKSRDMRWLAQLGHHVLGVELCETAVQEFFEELNVQPQVDQKGLFVRYSAENIELLVGDVFALTAEDLQEVAGVYDRAALVALPLDMRRDYVNLLAEIVPAKTQTLLITFEYRLGDREGPPFSIPIDAVQGLFEGGCDITLLDSQSFDLRGVAATEHVFRLGYF
ncbi:MAG: thiopurine S-methyltransferase [Nitrospirota bacterium]|nr:thiopurine S-methyltransferase [Nitrospirota bacterium]